MIFGSRSTELPFEVGQCAILPIHLFDFQFAKALKDRSVLHDRYVVERDVCDRDIVHSHADARPPDSQGRHRHEVPLSEMEKEQIAEQCRWNRLTTNQLNLLPVLHQSEFQLPGLFPPLDSMAQGDPSVGQVVLGSVVVGRGQQASWKWDARERGQAEMIINRQFDFTFDR
jgi:hypothetical protein